MHNQKVYTLNEDIQWNEDKRILIQTGEENIIQFARKNERAYEVYKQLLAHDYVHYFHDLGVSKFYKREHVAELFKRKDLIREKNVYYTLDAPKDRKVNDLIPKKLLVIFACMPIMKHYYTHLMPARMFPKFFDGIERNLVKNVYTMRIMDLNLSHGSHYVKTTNYPTYENEIQTAILRVIAELGIEKENVVLYGVSKGGTGAILHGSAMDLKTLAVDPILHLGEYNEKLKDFHFLKDFRTEDLTGIIDHYLNSSMKFDKYIIGSSFVPFNYEQITKLTSERLHVLDMQDEMINTHVEVSRNSVPEQLMILNQLLSNES